MQLICNQLKQIQNLKMVPKISSDEKHVLQSIISDKILEIKDKWTQNAPSDVFFGFEYLRNVEINQPDHIKPYYCVCFIDGQVVGLLHFHTSQICLRDNLRFDPSDKSITTKLKNIVTKCINIHCTVLGSTLITGNYGIHFHENVSDQDKTKLIEISLAELNTNLKTKGIKPGITVVKDFYVKEPAIPNYQMLKLHPFTVQPKMHLLINKEWISSEDYLQSLKSKYRIRYNKARSLLSEIVIKEFLFEDIVNHRDIIHNLYKNVSDNAGFNAFILHPKYFEGLKAALGDKCGFYTYWKGDTMVAFYTTIDNGDVFDAHFLGYIPEENVTHQLYLNMLLDLLKMSIDKKKSLLDLSRTAIEIKSTIGAVPQEMMLYIRHENNWMNKFTDRILAFINPKTEYIIRSPFKE
jgi:hypothetical protein